MGKTNDDWKNINKNAALDQSQFKQVSHEADKHVHEWHFSREDLNNYTGNIDSKFVCVCGAYKRIKQFEVEE